MASLSRFSPQHDQDIIEALCAGNRRAEEALFWLYERYFHKVRIALRKHRLAEDEVLEVYSDALMALQYQVGNNKFEGRSSLETFFARIFEFKCIDKVRRNTTKEKEKIKEAESQAFSPERSPEDYLIDAENATEADHKDARRRFCLDLALQPFNERDRAIMVDYFINGIGPSATAEKYQFKTDRVAATTASTLKRNLRQAIQSLCEQDARCTLLCE